MAYAPLMGKSPGRGPSGRLRNFAAMTDFKLRLTEIQLEEYHDDDTEAREAVARETLRRGSQPLLDRWLEREGIL